MRVGNISSNLSFGKVYAAAGTKEQVEKLRHIVNSSEGSGFLLSATNLYKNSPSYGLCTQAVKKGQEVVFVVAGKEDVEKVSYMEHGWSSINGISQHLDEFIQLDNVSEQAEEIQEEMKK